MSDRRQNEPLEPELQREDARGPDGAEQQFETREGPDDVPPPTEGTKARNEAWDETHEVGPLGEVQRDPEGVERFNREREEINEVPDQPDTHDPPDQRLREPGRGPSDKIEFDRNENVEPRESQLPARSPLLASGMFFPVIILSVVAVVVILIMVL